MNGPTYRENLVQTIALLSRNPLQPNHMGRAVIHNNVVYVEYLLRKGYPPNQLIDGMSPLGLSLTKGHDRIASALLNAGADPTLRSPLMNCSPLTLLAIRPFQHRTHDIVKRMIATLEKDTENNGIELVYQRIILDNDTSTADFLMQQFPQLCLSIRPNVIKALVHRNDLEAVVALQHVLSQIHKPTFTEMLVDKARSHTILHALLDVAEFVRDDALNLRILDIVLAKCSSIELLNAENYQGQTAMTTAVNTGNHYGVLRLLRAGADPEIGRKGNSILRALDRLIMPKTFSGGFSDISRRRRELRRYEYNSIRIVSIFLQNLSGASKPTDQLSQKLVEQSLPKWRSDHFVRASVITILPEGDRECTVKISDTHFPRLIRKDGSSRQLILQEAKAGMFQS